MDAVQQHQHQHQQQQQEVLALSNVACAEACKRLSRVAKSKGAPVIKALYQLRPQQADNALHNAVYPVPDIWHQLQLDSEAPVLRAAAVRWRDQWEALLEAVMDAAWMLPLESAQWTEDLDKAADAAQELVELLGG